MYEAIATQSSSDISAVDLMDGTLAGNFCPFRSPDWNQLANRQASVEFSRALWTDVLSIADPRVLICFGEVNDHLAAILERRGSARLEAPEVGPVGWGTITYSLSRYAGPSGETLLVRLPHLSRFGIFGRPQSRHAVTRLSTAIAAATAG